jgi:hypothetical protein
VRPRRWAGVPADRDCLGSGDVRLRPSAGAGVLGTVLSRPERPPTSALLFPAGSGWAPLRMAGRRGVLAPPMLKHLAGLWCWEVAVAEAVTFRHSAGWSPQYRAGVIGSGQRPLLFLDVDGPLIPFGAASQHAHGYPTYESAHGLRPTGSNPLLTRIDPAHGPRLTALPCDLVWATTWMDDANECVAPWLGLPRLPAPGIPSWSRAFDEPGQRES